MKNVISLKVRILGSNPFLTREYKQKLWIKTYLNLYDDYLINKNQAFYIIILLYTTFIFFTYEPDAK
jgi:hypothetical protein